MWSRSGLGRVLGCSFSKLCLACLPCSKGIGSAVRPPSTICSARVSRRTSESHSSAPGCQAPVAHRDLSQQGPRPWRPHTSFQEAGGGFQKAISQQAGLYWKGAATRRSLARAQPLPSLSCLQGSEKAACGLAPQGVLEEGAYSPFLLSCPGSGADSGWRREMLSRLTPGSREGAVCPAGRTQPRLPLDITVCYVRTQPRFLAALGPASRPQPCSSQFETFPQHPAQREPLTHRRQIEPWSVCAASMAACVLSVFVFVFFLALFILGWRGAPSKS